MNRGSSITVTRRPHWRYIFLTVVMALLLNALPLPESIQYVWPDWVMLVVFYWALVLPSHLGVMFGWINGFLEDIVSFSLLGQHALGKALTGMVVALAAKKMHLFNFIERMFVIFILQSISIAIVVWVNHLAFQTPVLSIYWMPALSTALIWPIASFVLSQLDPNVV
ncbi:MAG: rod shape-determining protein MreD [Arenicellales bacterium]